MRLGVLHPIKSQYPLATSVQMAIINFKNAPHCGKSGFYPAELHFNPEELPGELEINGLAVHPHAEVRPGYIRVATADLLPVTAQEFDQAKADFAAQVAAALP